MTAMYRDQADARHRFINREKMRFFPTRCHGTSCREKMVSLGNEVISRSAMVRFAKYSVSCHRSALACGGICQSGDCGTYKRIGIWVVPPCASQPRRGLEHESKGKELGQHSQKCASARP